jgi:hypothetical protein
VDPVPDPLLYFSGSAGNRTWASGSVAKNSDHLTTEAVVNTRTRVNKPFISSENATYGQRNKLDLLFMRLFYLLLAMDTGLL